MHNVFSKWRENGTKLEVEEPLMKEHYDGGSPTIWIYTPQKNRQTFFSVVVKWVHLKCIIQAPPPHIWNATVQSIPALYHYEYENEVAISIYIDKEIGGYFNHNVTKYKGHLDTIPHPL